MTSASSSWGPRLRLIASIASAAVIGTLVFMAVRVDPNEPAPRFDRSGPLPGYPPCDSFVPERAVPAVDGLVLPPSSITTRVRTRGPLERVRGYLPLTPPQRHRHYRSRSDVTVLQIEDEIIEAEALLSDGRFRSYLKASAVCDLGSTFIAVLAPEQAGSLVPTPAGGLPPGTP
jgi:hypothetical protein